jgi:N-hydroxyarylamine O-acetyltransferase
MAGHGDAIDLDAYLDRIGRPSVGGIDVATLSALHAAHVASIPFENLDVLWRRGIALDTASLQAKLVHGGRGGYCFEQNRLFALVLEALGFDVVPLAARVRYRATRLLPRTHQLLLVTIRGERYIADVGFGASTLLAPLPLVAGTPVAQHAWRYRLVREGDLHVLQIDAADGFVDLYAFTLEPATPPDLEMANWYVSTHPASRFVTTFTVQQATPTVRRVLQNLDYTEDRGGGDVRKTPVERDALPALLRGTFGLRLPDGVPLPLPAEVGPLAV